MTTLEFLRTAVRLWYVVLIGAIATAGLVATASYGPDVHTARVTLVVLMPGAADSQNVLQQSSPAAIASIAVMEVNGAPNRVTSSKAEATLVGRGVTRGESISLRHQGSQWAPSASEPYIDIEAADHTAAGVQQRIDDAVLRVRAAIRHQEDQLDVAPGQRVQLTQTPPSAVITTVPRSPTRAMAVGLLIGLGVTSFAVVRIDRLLRRRRRPDELRRRAERHEDAGRPTSIRA